MKTTQVKHLALIVALTMAASAQAQLLGGSGRAGGGLLGSTGSRGGAIGGAGSLAGHGGLASDLRASRTADSRSLTQSADLAGRSGAAASASRNGAGAAANGSAEASSAWNGSVAGQITGARAAVAPAVEGARNEGGARLANVRDTATTGARTALDGARRTGAVARATPLGANADAGGSGTAGGSVSPGGASADGDAAGNLSGGIATNAASTTRNTAGSALGTARASAAPLAAGSGTASTDGTVKKEAQQERADAGTRKP